MNEKLDVTINDNFKALLSGLRKKTEMNSNVRPMAQTNFTMK